MSFTKALYHHIKNNSLLQLYYGSANNRVQSTDRDEEIQIQAGTIPVSAGDIPVTVNRIAWYFVMSAVSEQGQATFMCEDQGTAGELRVQFTFSGGLGAGKAEDALNELRIFVIAIIGNIIYSENTYQIWQNLTSGVRPLGGPSMNTWDAIFESTFRWSKL